MGRSQQYRGSAGATQRVDLEPLAVYVGRRRGDAPITELIPGASRPRFFDGDSGDAVLGKDPGEDCEPLREPVDDENLARAAAKAPDPTEVVGQFGSQGFVALRVGVVKVGIGEPVESRAIGLQPVSPREDVRVW